MKLRQERDRQRDCTSPCGGEISRSCVRIQEEHSHVSPDTGPIESLINLSLCEVQVTFRGPSALESAVNARLSLGSSARAFDLWKLLGYSGTSGIQDLSAYYNGAIQPRSYFNFYFYALFNREYPADYFDKSKWNVNGIEITIPGEKPVCP